MTLLRQLRSWKADLQAALAGFMEMAAAPRGILYLASPSSKHPGGSIQQPPRCCQQSGTHR